MPLTVEQVAERAARRVDPNVGIDPLTITAIFTSTVLPILKCLFDNDEPDPVQVQAAVKERHDRNPEGLRRRTATKLMREARQKNHKVTRAQALNMADGLIAETLSADNAEVVGFCAAHKE